MILKSIGVLSCGKMMGIVYAILGLIVGGFFALFSLAGVAFQQAPGGNPRMMPFMAFGAAAVIIFPKSSASSAESSWRYSTTLSPVSSADWNSISNPISHDNSTDGWLGSQRSEAPSEP